MVLTPGTRLGPYEVLAPLGAGGMGEVHRARDSRLGRDVAIKVLTAALAGDPERRARFDTEARLIAALSHPNVLAVYDVGHADGIDYVVLEYVEGMTLRERMIDGPLSSARAMAFATQIARGLAAAHDRGVIHRDLKPENVMITPEGQAKVLDFGLSRRVSGGDPGSGPDTPTMAHVTEPGLVVGTMGYMSPEQVRGADTDARSDLFALGAVLFEMVAGRRAFRGETPADTMSAILREDPPELASLVADLPPALDRIVRRCLEKAPAARFRSAADLAFALESISSLSSGALPAVEAPALREFSFRRITYRNGAVAGARFASDGASIVYGAAWEGAAFEIYSSLPGSPESRHLGLPPASVYAISATGEMAIATGYRQFFWNQSGGVLGRVPMAGGGVRPLMRDVGSADWSPDGKSMAVIRYVDARCRLEYPAGKVLHETPAWLSDVRISPDGRYVAFAEHPFLGDALGYPCVIDTVDGSRRVLGAQTANINGVAWSPRGDEIWFSGLDAQNRPAVRAAGLDGTGRSVYVAPVRTVLHDVARDGRVLLGQSRLRIGLNLGGAAGERETDLSWFDFSVIADFMPGGRQVLFFEAGDAENPHYACYLRDIDGGPAVRLGEGTGMAVSPDGEWVLSQLNSPVGRIVMHPTGFGESRVVDFDGIERVGWAGFHRAGPHLLVIGSRGGRERCLLRTDLSGQGAEVLLDEELHPDVYHAIAQSADGDRIVLRRSDGANVVFTLSSRTVRPLPGCMPGDLVLHFLAAGDALLVRAGDEELRVDRLDLATGTRTPWRTLSPPDPTGITYVGTPVFTPDGMRYGYSYLRFESDLFLVDGLA